MKTVAVFGGSYNPPHDGHFKTAAHVHGLFPLDEIWMMFSVNRLKDSSKYESLKHRMAMGFLMAAHYPQVPFVMSDIEEKLGIHETWLVLNKMKALYPDHRFVWVMGADNLAVFDQWTHGDEIISNFPMVIIDRPPFTAQALNSVMAQKYGHLRKSAPGDMDLSAPGWVMVDVQNPNSSGRLLERMRAGETKFEGPFQDVADYIFQNGLYGFAKPAIPAQKPATPGPSGP